MLNRRKTKQLIKHNNKSTTYEQTYTHIQKTHNQIQPNTNNDTTY